MRPTGLFLVPAACAAPYLAPALAQTASNSDYRLTLADHKGLLNWSIDGFTIIESSAKPNGREFGIRGRDASGRLTFLGFLFLAPETAPMTSATCRLAAIAQDKGTNKTLTVLKTTELPRIVGVPVSLVTYTTANREGSLGYTVRGFVATGDLCGDLEFESAKPISGDDTDLKKAFLSYQLDPDYIPGFSDVISYAQVLFRHGNYREAAPTFEKALSLAPASGAPFKSLAMARRVMRDQAGMSYGISGDFAKARTIFENGIAEDPAYPMYYYNLACADAGEKKLANAKLHLQQAFARKANMNPGDTMPVPARDDSFLPYKSDRAFWLFIQSLR